MMGDWSKVHIPAIIDHNVSRQKNLAKPELISKKQLQQDYSELRDNIERIALLAGVKSVKNSMPAYTGPVSDELPTASQEARFYQFHYIVEMEGVKKVFEAGTPWWEIAQALDLHPFANSWRIVDFTNYLLKHYDFNINDEKMLEAKSGTEVFFGWNLTVVKN
jgi:hypothetical protein